MVVDMTVAEDLSLIEAQKEFMRRYRACEQDGNTHTLPMLASSCPGECINTAIVYSSLMNCLPLFRLGVLCRENTWKLHSSMYF